uniref:Uncharacterized protein n=1 Tax=Globodera pallida TaxID=36090 RepID=A0A183BL24_GLOPA
MHFLFLHLINSLSIFGVMPSRSSNSNAGGGRQSVRHERQPKANFGQSQFAPGGIFERRMFDSMNRKKNIFRDRWANGERKEANPTEPLGAGEIFEEELARQMREKNRNKPWEEEKENRAKSAGDEQIRLLRRDNGIVDTGMLPKGTKTNPLLNAV